MIKIILSAFVFLSTTYLSVQAQIKGIHFEDSLNWKEVKAKARAENKFIFMDCYATWCGPCKFMSEHIFPLADVGSFFNAHFISIKVQMDRTKADPEIIRQWYNDSKLIEQAFSVNALPTYLFFSPDGHPMHRLTGANAKDGQEFISQAADALNPAKQYYTLVDHYKEHPGDSSFLRQAIEVALANSDDKTASIIGNLYIDCLKNPYAKNNLQLILRITKSSEDKGFPIILNHPHQVDEIIGQKRSVRIVEGVISREDIHPFIDNMERTPDWKAIKSWVVDKYPVFGEETIFLVQLTYYEKRKDWKKYGKTFKTYCGKYGKNFDMRGKNSVAFTIFQHSESKRVLRAALQLAKQSVFEAERDWNLDTYANLLYKLGNSKEALLMEGKAVNLSGGIEKDILGNFEKMKKGEKTW